MQMHLHCGFKFPEVLIIDKMFDVFDAPSKRCAIPSKASVCCTTQLFEQKMTGVFSRKCCSGPLLKQDNKRSGNIHVRNIYVNVF